MQRITDLIVEVTGLQATAIGQSTITNAVARQMQHHQFDSVDEYFKLLTLDETEVNKLIELVVIPETWFFRDARPFTFLADAAKAWRADPTQSLPFRALSLPCSTGEETYSIVITLIEAGFTAGEYQVDGVDISSRNVENAQRGVYGAYSFRREREISIREIFLHAQGEHWQVNDALRQGVRFMQGNILDSNNLRLEHQYDVIFCRNLLIYFDADDRAKAFRALSSHLKLGGYLFVGHAEAATTRAAFPGYIEDPKAFVFQKTNAQTRSKAEPGRVTKVEYRHTPSRAPASKPKPKRMPPPPQPRAHRDASAANQAPPSLESARQLANEGELDRAEDICNQHLANHQSADAYFLLGLIEQARDAGEKAEACMRKAIYLEPGHYEALIHLTYLLEARGDQQAAQLFRRRAERARSPSERARS